MTDGGEPIHELGIQDAEGNFTALAALDYDTANDELALKHLQQNVEIRTDGTSWNPDIPLGDDTQPVPGTSHFEALETGDLAVENALAAYNLDNEITLPNNTTTDIDDWTENEDEIGSMSTGQNWSPNEDGKYRLTLIADGGTLAGSDTPVRADVSDHNIGVPFAFGNWIGHGGTTAHLFVFDVDMTASDAVSLVILHESGEEEGLRTASQLLINRLG